MKKNATKNFLRVLFLVLFIPVSSLLSNSQPLARKPYMWVGQKEGQARTDLFKTLKLPIIKADLKQDQVPDFKLENFFGMIACFKLKYNMNYLRVFPAVCNGSQVPPGFENRLILIFAPINGKGEIKDYFILHKRFNAANIDEFKIDKTTKDMWVERFVRIPLTGTIDPKDSDNEYSKPGTTEKIPSDTRFTTFCAEDLADLQDIKELYDLSSDVEAHFSAYTTAGTMGGRFKNRTLIQFDFLDLKAVPFYLDSIPGFLDLDGSGSKCGKILNNGQLCPVNCNNDDSK